MAGVISDFYATLRSRLSDDRASVDAFAIQTSVPCREALVEISGGFLRLSVNGGEAKSVSLDLSAPANSTVGALAVAVSQLRGWDVKISPTANRNHPSGSLTLRGIEDAAAGPVVFSHFYFSDNDIHGFLTEAAMLHNPNYLTFEAVPGPERAYVLMRARALAIQQLATDAARRKALSEEVDALRRLATEELAQYNAAVDRFQRVIPAPKADETKMGSGDVVQGTFFRTNPRTGTAQSPLAALPPTPPDLYEFGAEDVEDINIRIRFSQPRQPGFYRHEVWRDTQPNVERSANGGRTQDQGVLPFQSQFSRGTTSKQVMGPDATGLRYYPTLFGNATPQSAVSSAVFIDGTVQATGVNGGPVGDPLEPETDYYYRVFLVNQNGEAVPSQVRKARTKAMRARFKRTTSSPLTTVAPDAVTPVTGPLGGGTAITILGTSFVAGTLVTLNGKPCTSVVVVNSTTITCVSPAFTNTEWVGKRVDIVLTSPTRLQDILQNVWTVGA